MNRRHGNPNYGPGNPDYEYDAWRDRRDQAADDAQQQAAEERRRAEEEQSQPQGERA